MDTDDGVTIVTENEESDYIENQDANIHVDGRMNPDSLISTIWGIGTNLLTNYGWFFVAFMIIFVYYWPSIRSYLDRQYKAKSEKEYEAKCKKDPDWLHQRQLAMEAARKKMQEELDAKAALYAAKMKEKEELAAQKRAESNHITVGSRLGNGAPNGGVTSSSKKTYKPEYNPLMGSGGSGGYRPPRRGCPGGGCG